MSSSPNRLPGSECEGITILKTSVNIFKDCHVSADMNMQQNRFENPNFSLFVKIEEFFLLKEYRNLKIDIRGRITF